MPTNAILTTSIAGRVETTMAEDVSSSAKWPAYRFHPTLPPVCVANEEEEKALPEGYRDKTWTEEEADAWTKAQAAREEGEGQTSRRSHR